MLLGTFLFVAVSATYTKRDYFYKPNATTWDNARLSCQKCYKDLTTMTPTNAEFLSLNLISDYWIGLRQNLSSSKYWSRWANGEPVLYQNWYPGHPIPKKKPEPQPTCPPPPKTNNTKTEMMQCPAFMKLCSCLNSSGDYYDIITEPPITDNHTLMFCPALVKLCECLNSSMDNDTFIRESTTLFTTSQSITSPMLTQSVTSPMLASTSSPTINTEPEYIEDSCVALLSFGMWQEKQCNESMPYICYDDQLYGEVNILNVTKSGGNLSWAVAGINIAWYRIEINETKNVTITTNTSYQLEGLDPGNLYQVLVIPVKCERDLNAQNFFFYTLPEEIRNLSKVSADTNTITLTWKKSSGTQVVYLVCIKLENSAKCLSSKHCQSEICSITNLQPGQIYIFTVSAVVNVSISGEPDTISACTKPSKVINLSSSNNDSLSIYANWDSPDNNSAQYSYMIFLNDQYVNGGNSTKINISEASPSIIPGTRYTLNVSATLPACSEQGEAASIIAYTTPMPVRNLSLVSTENSITATWDLLNGSFAWFIVTINSSMSNITFPPGNTTNLNYTFWSLQAAALYTVNVNNYVEIDLKPSHTISESIYTKPNPPGTASVKSINNTSVQLMWEIPANSEGVKNINYGVTYFSDFWKHSGSQNITGDNSVIINGLKSGSRYKFNITVFAGSLESLPSMTTGNTDPVVRTLSLSMMCSSSTILYCMNDSTVQDVLRELENKIQNQFNQNLFWNLTLKKGN